ncbi:hypothetical protein [uncultured Litoreibacter sp.]|uniref:hypothetical protein n=1 Tax=uncultured Litoreibacter sp. TaxID=1392394 RepID=UPI0026298BBF|nr:hypothetical protein [uncultured Litoreibacter sp.]
MNRPEQIFGTKNKQDWEQMKFRLRSSPKKADWAEAMDEFFLKRIETRYLVPIATLKTIGNGEGEGFSIVTLQCALIEFLAAARLGWKYRYGVQSQGANNEYSQSKKLFVDFLVGHQPFSSWFPTRAVAEDFYVNVRCALVHEARTKQHWRIGISGSAPVDNVSKKINRDALAKAIDSYLADLKSNLPTDTALQDAFIRKMDDLVS